MQIDPGRRGKLPKVESPSHFTSPDGRLKGWKVRIPGGRTLATPALADGRIFLGGGFGSYEFYAFDADTGSVAWQYQTSDDGPTAAVVEEGFVIFNTESCELEVLTVEGRPVWKKWLGDPLMSMPAAGDGRVYMAFPDTRGDRHHYLACFGLADGREYWRQPIRGEIITAPVLADGHVYLATLDGTLYCFRKDDGALSWREPKDATSSPVVRDGQCYFSRREERAAPRAGAAAPQQWEFVAARAAEAGAETRQYAETARAADYLDHAKRMHRSPQFKAAAVADAFVGFAGHKGDAKMHQAMKNLGQGHVYGVWAYQGSKPFLSRGRLYSGMGDAVLAVEPDSGAVRWRKRLQPGAETAELLDSVVTPPALVNGKAFVGTVSGEVYCLAQESGDVLWTGTVGEPIIFQPAVVKGRMYVATGAGTLYALETTDPADDGWLMWGATAAHNGLVD